MPAKIHIGTSGWSYKHWEGLFYPPDIRPQRYLEYYATLFNTVELNTSFYHLPRESTIHGWIGRVPPSFRFCPKLSRYITHQLKLTNTGDALQKFFDLFYPMVHIMGPVLIQLPPNLKYNREKCLDFFEILKNEYGNVRFAIEVRHSSWMNEEFFGLLEEFGIAFTVAESGNRFPYAERVTTDFVYLRLHGAGQLYSSDYTKEQLIIYADKIRQWCKMRREVWVYFNNDVHGYAPGNALFLKSIINE